MHHLPILAASLALQLLNQGRSVQAQTTQAVCTSAHSWVSACVLIPTATAATIVNEHFRLRIQMLNSRGQNPCLVAAYLHLPCGGGQNSTSFCLVREDRDLLIDPHNDSQC